MTLQNNLGASTKVSTSTTKYNFTTIKHLSVKKHKIHAKKPIL